MCKMNRIRLFAFLSSASILLAVMAGTCSRHDDDNSYCFNGNVGDQVDAHWVYMKDFVTGATLDSARIHHGKFTFEGPADTMQLVYFQPGADGQYPAVGWIAIIEKGTMTMTTDDEYASGAPLNESLKDWMLQMDRLLRAKGDPKVFFDAHWAEHSADIVGPLVLSQVFPMLPFPYVDSLMHTVPDEVAALPYVDHFKSQLDAMRRLQPGQPFIDADLTTLKGAAAKLSDYVGHGDYLLVDFWASWCGPCRKAMPDLQATMRKYKHVKVLGIAVKDAYADTERAIRNLNITWPVLCSPDAGVAQIYGIYGIPAMILFGPDGAIVARDMDVAALDQLLATLQ